MPRFIPFTESLPCLAVSLGVFMAMPAFAQDLGTYRPGQAYQSVTAPAAEICSTHCAGDAQCSAWNYVKAGPKAVGVCEFLSSASNPVASQISISGVNTNLTTFSRPTQVGTRNTVRVGTSSVPSPSPSSSYAPSVTKTPQGRRVVREAVPQRINPSQTVNRRNFPQNGQAGYTPSLTEQQNAYRRQTGNLPPRAAESLGPRAGASPQYQQPQYQPSQGQGQGQGRAFRPLLDGAGAVAPANIYQGGQNANPNQAYSRAGQFQGQSSDQAPRNIYGHANRQVGRQVDRQARRQTTGQAAGQAAGQATRQAGRRDFDSRPPIGRPIGSLNSAALNSAPSNALPPNPIPLRANVENSTPQGFAVPRTRGQASSSVNLPRASASHPVTRQNAQTAFARRQADLAAIASGNSVDPIQQSLYGTLNDDVKVPVAVKNIPLDHNLPIATSASRPVAPVSREPLGGLAGGPGR